MAAIHAEPGRAWAQLRPGLGALPAPPLTATTIPSVPVSSQLMVGRASHATSAQITKRIEELRRTLDLDYGSGERAPSEVVEGYLAPSRADGWDEGLLRLFRNFETGRRGPTESLAYKRSRSMTQGGARALCAQGTDGPMLTVLRLWRAQAATDGRGDHLAGADRAGGEGQGDEG